MRFEKVENGRKTFFWDTNKHTCFMSASTVPNYTIPEIRRSLDIIRRSWINRQADFTFQFDKVVSENHDDTIWSFSLRFMMGHHRKRHSRRARKRQPSNKGIF
jgi:hypothetical protein